MSMLWLHVRPRTCHLYLHIRQKRGRCDTYQKKGKTLLMNSKQSTTRHPGTSKHSEPVTKRCRNGAQHQEQIWKDRVDAGCPSCCLKALFHKPRIYKDQKWTGGRLPKVLRKRLGFTGRKRQGDHLVRISQYRDRPRSRRFHIWIYDTASHRTGQER